MALGRYQNVIVDDAGNVVSLPVIEVRRQTAGTPLEPLFSDRDGAVPITNPFTGNADGTFHFHCAGGSFRILATKGALSRLAEYVPIGTAAEADADGYAAAAAAFVTVGASGLLANERALAVGQGLKFADGGAGAAATIRRASENVVGDVVLDWPPGNDACVRVSANINGHGFGVGCYGGGTGLWLYDPFAAGFRYVRIEGNGHQEDLQNMTVNGVAGQSAVNGTAYWIYAYVGSAGAAFPSYEISTTAFGGGDPLGASQVTGFLFKNDGTRNKRLIGAVESNASGVFWQAGSRGVFMSGIASYYNRQQLNYHIKPPTGVFSNTTWAEIDSSKFLSALMWEDGGEPFLELSGSLNCNTATRVVNIGISIDGENPPFDFVPIYIHTANQPIPFSITVTGGDFSTDLHTYRIWSKIDGGAASAALNANGTFAMKLEQ